MIYKRDKLWHLDVTIHGVRYREALDSTDRREALSLEKKRVGEILAGKAASKSGREFGRKPFSEAADQFLEDRKPHVAARTHQLERNLVRPLRKFFWSGASAPCSGRRCRGVPTNSPCDRDSRKNTEYGDRRLVKEAGKRAGNEAAKLAEQTGGNVEDARKRAAEPFLKFRFHDLRHQAITELAEGGSARRNDDGTGRAHVP